MYTWLNVKELIKNMISKIDTYNVKIINNDIYYVWPGQI